MEIKSIEYNKIIKTANSQNRVDSSGIRIRARVRENMSTRESVLMFLFLKSLKITSNVADFPLQNQNWRSNLPTHI